MQLRIHDKGQQMANRTYAVTITGKTPLLMHADNIDWADSMEEWKNSPANKKGSKAGDDRSPAWRWLGALYHDDNILVMPSDNLQRCFMEGGAMVPVPGGRSGKTFKSQSQSGMMTGEPVWPLLVNGKTVAMDKINKLRDTEKFAKHKEACAQFGFMLFVKRAKIGQSKHIRVRPRFDHWSTAGTLVVWDDQITADVLTNILEYAGNYKGLGDWRPGGKTPGPHGMFTAEVKAL
jgi:hypothetical protein